MEEGTSGLFLVSSVGCIIQLPWISSNETILQVKQRLQARSYIDSSRQELFYEQKQLRDHTTLLENNIEDRSCLVYVYVSSRPTQRIQSEIENQDKLFYELLGLDKNNPFEATMISEGLFLGNIHSALNLKGLKANGISHILTVHEACRPVYPEHFEYLWLKADDLETVNLFKHFCKIRTFIDEGRKQGGVLVHCTAGRSRSATITIAYLMATLNQTFHETLKLVQSKRNIVNPNEGFREQLQIFQMINCNFENLTEKWERMLLQYMQNSKAFRFSKEKRMLVEDTSIR